MFDESELLKPREEGGFVGHYTNNSRRQDEREKSDHLGMANRTDVADMGARLGNGEACLSID